MNKSTVRPTGKAQDAIENGERLSDQVYLHLRRMIVENVLEPGACISEAGLCREIGQGKAPVRAALTRLAQEKLVTPVARKGYVIRPLTVQDAKEIFDLRLALEPWVASQAAGRITAEAFEPLRAAYALGYEPSDPISISRFLAANREFRLIIARAAQNERVIDIISNLLDGLERYLRLSFSTHPNRTDQLQAGFQGLVEAIVGGASRQAELITRRQIEMARRKTLEALLSRGEILGQPLGRGRLAVSR